MADVMSTTAITLGQQLCDIVRQAIANRGGAQKATAIAAIAPKNGVFFTIAGDTPPVVAAGKTAVTVLFDNATVATLADQIGTWAPPTGALPS